jgi:hypothetical protein
MHLDRSLEVRNEGSHKGQVAVVERLITPAPDESQEADQFAFLDHRRVEAVQHSLRRKPVVVELALEEHLGRTQEAIVADNAGLEMAPAINEEPIPGDVVLLVRTPETGIEPDFGGHVARPVGEVVDVEDAERRAKGLLEAL